MTAQELAKILAPYLPTRGEGSNGLTNERLDYWIDVMLALGSDKAVSLIALIFTLNQPEARALAAARQKEPANDA